MTTQEISIADLERVCNALSNDEHAKFAVRLFTEDGKEGRPLFDETTLPFYDKIKSLFGHGALDDKTKATICMLAAERTPPLTVDEEMVLNRLTEIEV